MSYPINFTVDRDELIVLEIDYDYEKTETIVIRALKKFSPVKLMADWKMVSNNVGPKALYSEDYVNYLVKHGYVEQTYPQHLSYNNLWHSKGAKVK